MNTDFKICTLLSYTLNCFFRIQGSIESEIYWIVSLAYVKHFWPEFNYLASGSGKGSVLNLFQFIEIWAQVYYFESRVRIYNKCLVSFGYTVGPFKTVEWQLFKVRSLIIIIIPHVWWKENSLLRNGTYVWC